MSDPSIIPDRDVTRILRDRKLAQFGDSLLNFAYSWALTQSTKHPIGIKVKDRTLARAAEKAGLRQYLTKRVDKGDVANSLEALVGEAWLRERITLEEILSRLKQRELDDGDESKPFVRLAELALSRLGHARNDT